MKQSKLRRIHVVIIGAVVCVIVGVGLFFVLIKPANENLATEEGRLEKYQPTGTQANVTKAQQDLSKAVEEVEMANRQLNSFMRAKMPNLSFADPPGTEPGKGRALGMLALWEEQNDKLPGLIESWIVKRGHVTLKTGVTVPKPTFNPNDPVFEADTIQLDLGKVKIHGSYLDIIDQIKSWKACNRLVDISGVSFTGSSPGLECEYQVKVYLMPRFKADKSKPLGIAAAATGGGGIGAGVPSAPPAAPAAPGPRAAGAG